MKGKRFGSAPLRYLLGFFAAVAVWYVVYCIVAYIMAVFGKVPFLGAILYYPSDFAFAAVSIPIFCSVAAAAYCSNWICGTERPFCIAAIIVYGVTLIAAIVTRVITWRTFEGCALMIATAALFFFDSDPVREKKEKRKKSNHKSAISEVVANSIDTACVGNLGTYERAIISLLKTGGLKGEELAQALNNEKKLYKDSVFDDVWEALPQDPGIDFRVRACFSRPTIAGAPESVTTEYIDENGISADLAYLFFVYAITGISASELSPERAAKRTAEAHKLYLRQSYLIEDTIQDAVNAYHAERAAFEQDRAVKPAASLLKSAMKISCENQAVSYKRALISILKCQDLAGEERERALNNALRLYRNGAFESARKMVLANASVENSRVESCLQEPSVSGAPEYATSAYIVENGIPADAAYCFLFYGSTGLPVSDPAIEGAAKRQREMLEAASIQIRIISKVIQAAEEAVAHRRP